MLDRLSRRDACTTLASVFALLLVSHGDKAQVSTKQEFRWEQNAGRELSLRSAERAVWSYHFLPGGGSSLFPSRLAAGE